jgi:hypothetical protein
MKRIRERWWSMPESQRVALFLVPLAGIIAIYIQATGRLP